MTFRIHASGTVSSGTVSWRKLHSMSLYEYVDKDSNPPTLRSPVSDCVPHSAVISHENSDTDPSNLGRDTENIVLGCFRQTTASVIHT